MYKTTVNNYTFSKMRGNLDSLCHEMNMDPRNSETQSRCIGSLLPHLKNERSVDQYQKAFKCIDNAVKACNSSEQVIFQTLNLFEALVQIRSTYPILEATNIFSIEMYILSQHKDNSQITEFALEVIAQTIEIPRIGPHFSSGQFVQTLAFVGRVNRKSQIHTMHIANISAHLNPRLEEALKDLCNMLIVQSRNFARIEQLQELLTTGFAHIASPKIMLEAAAVAVPHFTKVVQKFAKNYVIFKGFLSILGNAPQDSVADERISIIIEQRRNMKDDPVTMQKAIEVLATKMTPKKAPISIVPLLTAGLSMFISNPAVVKQALTACYYAVTASNEEAPTSPKLISVLSAVLSMHHKDPSLVRRVAAILHALSSTESNDVYLSQNGVPFGLLHATMVNMKDKSTVNAIIGSLSNFSADNPVIASQMNTKDHLKVIMQILNNYKKVSTIVKCALLVLRSIALSTLGFEQFIDASADIKAKYLISSKIGISVLKTQLGNIDLVKAVLLLMKPDPEASQHVAAAMLKYSSDKEVQISGLLHNVTDLSAINRALQLCGESALRFAIKSLRETEKSLPQQLVEFLLTLDRNDAVELLVTHVGKATCPVISSRFSLEFPEQIVIAKALADKGMWKPEESDYPVILTSMYHSIYDSEQLLAALTFVKQIGLTETSYQFLVECMKTHSNNREIVMICAEFMAAFTPDEFIEQTCIESNAVVTAAYAMKTHKKDEQVVFSLLKMFHHLSLYNTLYPYFSGSTLIPMITKTAKLSRRCSMECCCIFTNLSADDNCVLVMNNCGASEVAFEDFSIASYEFVESMMSSGLKPTPEQFSLVQKDFTANSMQLSDTHLASLLHILLSCYENEEDPVNDIDYKLVNSLLKVHTRNPLIVRYCTNLLAYSDGYQNSEELLYGVVEGTRININDYDTVKATLNVIQHFSKVEKHKATLDTPLVVELMSSLLTKYISDVNISCICLTIMRGRAEAVPHAIKALTTHTEESTVIAACHCISTTTINSEKDPDVSITPVIETVQKYITSLEVCQSLMPVLFFASGNAERHESILAHIDLIMDVLIRYITVIQIVKACLGIVCNLSEEEHNITRLSKCPPLIGLAMKVRLNDEQIQYVGGVCIQNFARCGKGKSFITAIPVLHMCLKDKIHVQSTCASIQELKDDLGEMARFIAADLIEIVKSSDEKITAVECLRSIAEKPGVEEMIADNREMIFNTVKEGENEELSGALLTMCSEIRNPALLLKFSDYISQLLALMTGNKLKIAASAARCVLTLAACVPSVLDSYADEIIKVSDRASGDVLRLCLQIREKLFAIRPRKC